MIDYFEQKPYKLKLSLNVVPSQTRTQMNVPILYYAYNRPQSVSLSLEAIKNQTVLPPLLIAICDGAKSWPDTGVERTRQLIKSVDWVPTTVIERPTNLGCAGSIVTGLNEVIDDFGALAILEDDVIAAPCWYESILAMLSYYESARNVFAVGGYPSVNNGALQNWGYDTIISPRFSCWGWGTWADRWNQIKGEMLGGEHDWTADTISDVAGCDIIHMLKIYKPMQIWDVTIAAACLHRGWQHALTKDYLIRNLGCEYPVDFGVKIPAAFAPANHDNTIADLVRQHVFRGG